MDLIERIKDKIFIDEDTHDIYKKLKEELHVFSSMRGIFLIAAAVGFYIGDKKRLTKKKDIFNKIVFKKDMDLPFIYMLAIADKKDLDAVDMEPLSIAEEYANAGIRHLWDRIKPAVSTEEAIDEIANFLIEEFLL